MEIVSFSGLVAATPATAVDRIVIAAAALSSAHWAALTLTVLAVVLWVVSRIAARRSTETLNARSAREVEEARR